MPATTNLKAIGIEFADGRESFDNRVVVTKVYPGSATAKENIHVCYTIDRINNHDVRSAADVTRIMQVLISAGKKTVWIGFIPGTGSIKFSLS